MPRITTLAGRRLGERADEVAPRSGRRGRSTSEHGDVDADLGLEHLALDCVADVGRQRLARRLQPGPILGRQVVGLAGVVREAEHEVVGRADVPVDPERRRAAGQVADGRSRLSGVGRSLADDVGSLVWPAMRCLVSPN